MKAPTTIRRRLHSRGAKKVSAFTPPPHEQGSGVPSCTGGGAEPRIGPSAPDLLGNLAYERDLGPLLVFGQLVAQFARVIDRHQLAQSYLFMGPKGAGKLALALWSALLALL